MLAKLSDHQTVSKVYRLQFRRSVQAIVPTGSILNCEVICCSEFNEPVNLDINYSVFICKQTNGNRVASFASCTNLDDVKQIRKTGGITLIKGSAPDEPGFYCVSVAPRTKPDGLILLPLYSDVVRVCNGDEFSQYIESTSAFIPRLLGCYRAFECCSLTVSVKEEYGNTLGSHIYDSSIILVRYIESNIASLLANNEGEEPCKSKVVLELGAGCGMVGLYVAALLAKTVDVGVGSSYLGTSSRQELMRPFDEHTVGPINTIYITDREQQKGLIEHNISSNSHLCTPSTHIQYADLDWAITAHIEHIRTVLSGNDMTLIVAGDVFYDRQVAALFFTVLNTLCIQQRRFKVLVAQKLRLNQDNVAVALISEEEIRADCGFACVTKVYEEADVILWLLSM